MESLRAEIAKKKASNVSELEGKKKYVRKGELIQERLKRLRQEEEIELEAKVGVMYLRCGHCFSYFLKLIGKLLD